MVGQPYKRMPPEGSFDAIVVGSGPGGLSCAIQLAKAGKRVMVLERHYTLGGFMHTFTRKHFEWDVGLHYVGDVHRPQSLLRRLFDDLSGGGLSWAAIPDPYDTCVIGQDRYPFPAGREALRERLRQWFPRDGQPIDRYFELLHQVRRATAPFFANRAMPWILGRLLGPWMRGPFKKLVRVTTQEVLSSLTSNRRLQAVLCTQYGDYGLPPGESSFAMHALVVNHYLNGAAYPIGGSGAIVKAMLNRLESLGSVARVRAGVAHFLLEGNRCTGVVLENGDQWRAPLVVSNAGYANTFGPLMQRSWNPEVPPSAAHVCLYAGLKGAPDSHPLPQGNLWRFPSDDLDGDARRYREDSRAPFPMVYHSFASAKDPSWTERFPGRATMEVIVPAHYQWFSAWEHLPWHKRGRDYEAFKTGFEERLVAEMERELPGIASALTHVEVSTPLSTRHFSGYARGEIYGLEHTPRRFACKDLGPRTPIGGLFLTGQDVVTDGLAGAVLSGFLTASAVLGRNLIKEHL
jgi:all-trans-retinol 13,14-reductase